MAVYNLSNQPKKVEKSPRDKNKIVGIILIIISSIAFLCLLTSFFGFLKSFLLGTIGLFSYPFFIVMFIIGVALINNKKYVMTTKYIVYLSIAILSLLCLLHLIFIDTNCTFGQYLANCYSQKMTIGGIIIGLITAPFVFLLNKATAYVVFTILFIVFCGLIADYIYYLNKSQVLKNPIKLTKQNTNNIMPKIDLTQNTKLQQTKVETINVKEKPTNIVLNAKLDSEKEEDIAKRKLGLIKSSSEILEKESVVAVQPTVEQKNILPDFKDKESLRNFLLTPETKIDMAKFNKSKPQNKQNEITEKIEDNFDKLKNSNETFPSKIVHDDSSSFNINLVNEGPSKKPYIAPDDSNNVDENAKVEPSDTRFAEDVLASLIKDAKINEVEPIKPENSRRGFRNLNLDDKYEAPKTVQETFETNSVIHNQQIHYIAPPIDLLTTKSMDLSELNEDVILKRQQLESALDTFGIPAKVIEVVVGPAVTRYELEMPVGISVKKLLACADDIALNLAANGEIRIEAPIPGKSAVGIEVPNEKVATIGLKDMIASQEFQNAKAPLTFVLGKDIAGQPRLCNLAKMPHLLVAGSTGSGKSVCLNAVILSLIYKTSPDDVRLILIDPKQVEFSIYNGLPHLLMPNVITDSEKALSALNWAVNEMERRYTLFKNTRTRDIGEYHNCKEVVEKRQEKIPYIVIIIDEVADLLMTAKKEVEEKIARLAQKARGAGIHLILATQRPSVDVITGTMKNNFPSRISFKLMSFADSKTILDQAGAEKLLGKGDMLYKPSDASEPTRIQGCFVTSNEVNNIVEYCKEKNSDFDYDDNIANQIMNPQKNDIMGDLNGSNTDGFDPLFPQAVKCFIENGQASISMLQRRLVIGYQRAARIVDQIEEMHYIGPADGSKPRSILITMDEYNKIYGDNDE